MDFLREISFVIYAPADEELEYEFIDRIIELMEELGIDSTGVIASGPYKD